MEMIATHFTLSRIKWYIEYYKVALHDLD